jgi:hypothetical protein
MDDLARQVKDGFDRVDREFKAVHSEIARLRAETRDDIGKLRTEIGELRWSGRQVRDRTGGRLKR